MAEHQSTPYEYVYIPLDQVRPDRPLETQLGSLTYVEELDEDEGESWTSDKGDTQRARRRREALGESLHPTHLRVERGWAEAHIEPVEDEED